MKSPKMSPTSNLGNAHLTPNDFQQRIGFCNEFGDDVENEEGPQIPFTTVSSASKKKILAERNSDEPLLPYPSKTHFQETRSPFLRIHSISDSSDTVPYDPVNNYTSPRPAFLRYNPNRRKEILLRMREDEESAVDLGTSRDEEKTIEEDLVSESSSSSKFSFQVEETQGDDEVVEASDAELDDFEEQEVEEKRSWCSRMVWKLVLMFGVFLFSRHFLFSMDSWTESLSNPLQENVSTIEKSPFYRDLLKTHMGFSDACLDVGDAMCGIKGPGSDSVGMKDPATGHFGDSIKNDLLMSDEIKEVRIVEEFDVDSVSFLESLVQELNSQSEQSGEVIAENETTEISSISADALYDHFVSDESTEDVQAPHFESFPSLLQDGDDQVAEESEISIFHGTLLRWKHRLEFDTKHVQMIFFSLGLLTITIGLMSTMFKYFATSHQKPIQMSVDEKKKKKKMSAKDSSFDPLASTHCSNEQKTPFLVSPPSPMLVPCSLPEVEKTVYPTVSATEEFRADGRDSYVHPLSSSYLSNEIKEFYASRPPTVSLLGEFSIESSSAQTLKSKGSQESQLTKSERKSKAKIKSPPSSNKVHPYHAQENLAKQKDIVEKSEGKKMESTAHTPLRRSNRLQNRVTSPTP